MRILLSASLLATVVSARYEGVPFLNMLPFLSTKKYTPLIFFRVPPGLSPECDAMEQSVQEIEGELGIHVDRMDIARNKEAAQLMQLIGQDMPPVLYHRESRQVYQLRPPSGAAAVEGEGEEVKAAVTKVDMTMVRALAKGRRLPVQRDVLTGQPVLIGAEGGLDQDELLEQELSPLQRKGRQAMKARSGSSGNM